MLWNCRGERRISLSRGLGEKMPVPEEDVGAVHMETESRACHKRCQHEHVERRSWIHGQPWARTPVLLAPKALSPGGVWSGTSMLLPLGFFYSSGFKEPIPVPTLISKVTLGISPWTNGFLT